MKRRKHNPDDARALDAEFFARAERIPDGLAALSAAIRAADAERRRRGKQRAPTKQMVSIRLSADVLGAYRSTGRGWQSRIDADLKKSAKRLVLIEAKPSRGVVVHRIEPIDMRRASQVKAARKLVAAEVSKIRKAAPKATSSHASAQPKRRAARQG